MIRLIFVLGVAGALTLSSVGRVWAGSLRASASRVEITPAAEDFPYTAPGERPYVGVHDQIYARALVFDDGKQRAAVVMVEVTKLPDPVGLARAVAREIKAPEANVLVAATHTHNVPLVFFHEKEPNALQARQIEQLTQGALSAVRNAYASLQPARIAFKRGEAWVNVNNGEQAGLTSGYDPNGYSDKTLTVLRVSKEDGTPIALLVNYATHGEVMFRSATRDGGYEVSGDLPGAVSRILEGAKEAAPVVLYSPAAEADQTTLKSLQPPAGSLPGADEGAAGWALLNVQARRVALAVQGVLVAMPQGESTARIEAASAMPSCPGQHMRRDPATHAISTEDTPPVGIPLSVLRISDIVLAGVGGDVASEIGRQFKAALPGTEAMLITMANGGLGYLLPDASYDHPGHGVMGSPLKPHCAERTIVDGLVRLSQPGFQK
jgi:hypothetical protein